MLKLIEEINYKKNIQKSTPGVNTWESTDQYGSHFPGAWFHPSDWFLVLQLHSTRKGKDTAKDWQLLRWEWSGCSHVQSGTPCLFWKQFTLDPSRSCISRLTCCAILHLKIWVAPLQAFLADTQNIRVAESLLSWWGPQKALTTTRIYTTVEGTHRTSGEHQNTVQISTVSEGTNGCFLGVDGCWWVLPMLAQWSILNRSCTWS